jgi:hypothetical protein
MMNAWLSMCYTGPFQIPIPIEDDLTQEQSIIIHVRRPNGEETTWDVDDIQPHSIGHNFVEGELDISGNYILKVESQMPNNVEIS